MVEHYKVQTGDLAYSIIAGNIAPHLSTVERRTFGNKIGANNGLRSLKVGEIIHYDPADIPVVVPPVVEPPVVLPPIIPPYTGNVPARSQVGRRTSGSTAVTGRINPGTYTDKIISAVLNPGVFTFTDDRLALNLPDSAGSALVDHCDIFGGWFENGGHNGWDIGWSWIDGGTGQALRPKGPGLIKVTDSLMSTMGTSADPALGIHTEAMQMLSGASGEFTRVGFSCEPRWNGSYTPITAVINVSECGPGTVFTDCVFGYLDPQGKWGRGGGYFAVYPGQATFVRPVIYCGGNPANAWYNGQPPQGLVDPVYL